MADMFPLWSYGTGLEPTIPEDERIAREYVRKCVDHGVTRLIEDGAVPVLVRIAHENGLGVDTYRAVNSYGANIASYEMSISYVMPPLGAPEAREVLDKHRPIVSVTGHDLNVGDALARDNRRYWNRTRDGRIDPAPNERLSLSLGYPEVRQHEADLSIAAHKKSNSDGTQMEFVNMNADEDGVDNYGYEEPIVEAFVEKYHKDPFEIPNDDPDWLQHRADYVTLFVRELREKLRVESPGARLTSTLIAREPDDYLKGFQDWPAWLDEGLVDEFYLWFRTTSDLGEVERQTRHASDVVGGRVPLIVELSCYHPGSFQEPDILLEAAKRARGNGADAVGLYRSHAVEQLNLWPVVEQITQI